MRTRPSILPALACGLVAAAALVLPAAPLRAATPEEQAVLAPFQAVLDAIGKRDRNLMRDNLLPGGMATLMRDGKPVQLHFDSFVEHVPTTGTKQLAERIHDPLVHIDDDVAVIWAPYEFLVDGKVDHCGTDIAHLVKRDGRWLVAGIADNSRKACPGKP
jgi:hypothetical protein